MARVLVVDDDYDTREALRFLLEDAGYMVLEAADGLEGLAAIQESTDPLVVLLDFTMPKLNGVEVLQTVARDPRLAARHAFILITARSPRQHPAAEEVCATLSALLIVKPYHVQTFLDQVASAAHRLSSAPPDMTHPGAVS